MSIQKYALFLFVTLIFLVLIKLLNISYPVTLTSTNRTTEFSVVGEGKVEVRPDTAYVDAGITINNATSVEEAQKQINDISNNIIDAMGRMQIQKADIKTSNYSIYPNYVYEQNQNRLSGYNGNVTISIKVTDIQKASQVIAEATKAGANQIQGTSFTVDNPEKLREEARTKAINNAKEQADKLSKSLGIKLGQIVSIDESTNNPSFAQYDARSALTAPGGGGGAPVETGTQVVSSVVTVRFERK